MLSRKNFICNVPQCCCGLLSGAKNSGNFVIGKKPTVIIIGAGFSVIPQMPVKNL
jgi:hypothetical protein